ncbi:MAG: fimbrillin family protein [Prevotellaceae bacterium]|jgi:hypothetical protein|nr:fimbrillin family protein [Prevotellaceae bacterium]
MKKVLFFAATLAAVMTGCSNSEELANEQNTDRNPIGFRAVTNLGEETRASVTDFQNLKDFRVYATYDNDVSGTAANKVDLMNGVNVTRNIGGTATGFSYAPVKYWPAGNQPVLMYAYSPAGSVNVNSAKTTATAAATANDGGKIEIAYTVPWKDADAGARQEDFMFATKSVLSNDYAGSTHSGYEVPMVFNHILSKLTFSAVNAAGSGLTYTIKKIEVTGMGNAATYTYTYSAAATGSGSWGAPAAQTGTYEASLPGAGIAIPFTGGTAELALTSYNEGLMILPQTSTAANSNIKITYDLKDAEGTALVTNEVKNFLIKSKPFAPGTSYNVKMTFGSGAYNDIAFTVSTGNWSSDTGITL